VKANKRRGEGEVAKEQLGGTQFTGGLHHRIMELQIHLVQFIIPKSLVEEYTHA
jgi:hypothetical protein